MCSSDLRWAAAAMCVVPSNFIATPITFITLFHNFKAVFFNNARAALLLLPLHWLLECARSFAFRLIKKNRSWTRNGRTRQFVSLQHYEQGNFPTVEKNTEVVQYEGDRHSSHVDFIGDGTAGILIQILQSG